MKRAFNVSTSVLPMMLAAAWAITSEAKEPAHFVAANVSKAGNIPYPASSLDAGVVTLSVDLDKTGQVTGVRILRDISSVLGAESPALPVLRRMGAGKFAVKKRQHSDSTNCLEMEMSLRS
jgi:hypothetical protein